MSQQPLSPLNERLSRLIGQLIVAIEEKAAQIDQMQAHIKELEDTIVKATELAELNDKI